FPATAKPERFPDSHAPCLDFVARCGRIGPPSLCFTLLSFSVHCRPMVVLKTNKLFSGMLAAELQALEQTAQLKTYKAGRNIFQEGDPGDGLYIIVEGKVQITCLVGQDQRRVLSRLGAGGFFGEMAVLD